MKKLVLLLGVLLSLSAMAKSTGGGNGGGAAKCGTKYRMADLVEGEYRHNLEMKDFSGMGYEEIKAELINKLLTYNPALGLKVLEYFDYYHERKLLRDNPDIFVTHDYGIIMLPKNCEYLPVANWDNVSGNIFLYTPIHDYEFDTVNQLALEFHEAIYKAFRKTFYKGKDLEDINSDTARRYNAYLFSTSVNPDYKQSFYQSSELLTFLIEDKFLTRDAVEPKKLVNMKVNLNIDGIIEIIDSGFFKFHKYRSDKISEASLKRESHISNLATYRRRDRRILKIKIKELDLEIARHNQALIKI